MTARYERIGLVPAAGRGTRIGLPFPKELFLVIGREGPKPAIRFALELLRDSGVKHTAIVINETKAQLLSYLQDGGELGIELSYVAQADREADRASTSSGLGHALNAAYHLTRGKVVCFAMADTIIVPDDLFTPMLALRDSEDADVVFGLFEVQDPSKVGMVDIDADGVVHAIIDKPKQTDLKLAWGCMCWSPAFTEHLKGSIETGVADFAGILNGAIQAGLRVRGYHSPSAVYFDLGTPEDAWRAQRWYHEQQY